MMNLNKTGSNLLIPRECPSCKTSLKVEGIHLHCSNSECPEQAIQQITYWCKKCKMDGVSEGTVRKLWNEKVIQNITDLYHLTINDIKDLDGFGLKSATLIVEEIHKTKSMNIHQFINRLGIPSVGTKALIKLGINQISDFNNFNDDTYATGRAIIKWKKHTNKVELVSDLLQVLNINSVNVTTKKKTKVCMTGNDPWGIGRKTLSEDIAEKGHVFVKSLTKDTNILVCADVTGDSTKLQKARKYNTKIVSYNEYFSY